MPRVGGTFYTARPPSRTAISAMPVAVAPAQRGHSIFSSTFRGRNRAVSEVQPPPPREPERVQLPKAASYTYFPRVKDLDQAVPVVELKGTISEEDLQNAKKDGRTSDSSGGSSPASEDGPDSEVLQMPVRRPTTSSRRSSRFLPFSSKSREPSAEPKPDRKADRGRPATAKKEDPPSESPARSLSKLRRKSWIVSQQQQEQQPRSSASPTRSKLTGRKEEKAKKSQPTSDVNKRKTPASAVSIPEESEARDPAADAQQPRPLSKKNKRLSGFFNQPSDIPPVPAIPTIPTSFSTEKLSLGANNPIPLSPASVPPLPRNLSTEKLKGVKAEPRKKDELWTVFRTLDADLRK